MLKIISLIIVLLTLCEKSYPFQLMSDYLANCTDSDECTDHRFVCEEDENRLKRCVCHRFYKWAGPFEGCIRIYNYTQILNMTVKENHLKEQIEREEKLMFLGNMIGGYFIIGVVGVAVMIILYYVIDSWNKDRKMKGKLKSYFQSSPEYIPPRDKLFQLT